MAGREYEVGGTVYEFPDSFDDAKVKGILTQKGVIKPKDAGYLNTLVGDITKMPASLLQAAKHPLDTLGGIGSEMAAEQHKGKEEVRRGEYLSGLGHTIAGGIPIIGPLAARAGEEIGEARTGEGLAHATEALAPFVGGPALRGARTGARAVLNKLPSGGTALDIAGVVSPRAAHAISLVNRVRKIFGKEPAPEPAPTPYPPGKGTGTKYGGPTEPTYSAPGTTIPRKGFTPPAEPVPTPQTPFKPSSGIARTIKYGGPADPGYGAPGKVIPRGKFTPPTEPASTPYQPVRPNPNIAKKLRSGGSEDPYGGRAYRSTPRRASTKALPTETEESIRETLPTKAGTAKPVRETDISEQLQESIAEQHKVKVSKVVNLLKSSGIDAEMAENANEAQIKDILKQADVRNFHDLDTAWNEIVDALGGKSWPAKGPTPPMPPSRFGK